MQELVVPSRKQPIVTGEVYHVFNRGIGGCETFLDVRDHKRAQLCLWFYLRVKQGVKFSRLGKMSVSDKEELLVEMKESELYGEIYAYCLMKNHFHLLIRQKVESGVSKFLANFQNSYTKYFNVKYSRFGSLFVNRFKAVRIETDEQLFHVMRYIHLNPFTGFLVEKLDDLVEYRWSSLREYLDVGVEGGLCNTEQVKSYFSSTEELKKFIFDHADYQRELGLLKHLTFE